MIRINYYTVLINYLNKYYHTFFLAFITLLIFFDFVVYIDLVHPSKLPNYSELLWFPTYISDLLQDCLEHFLHYYFIY